MSYQQNPFEVGSKKNKKIKVKPSSEDATRNERARTVDSKNQDTINNGNKDTDKSKIRLSNRPKLIVLIILILSLPTILTLVFTVTDLISYNDSDFDEMIDDYYEEQGKEMKELEDPNFVWDSSLIDDSIENSEMFDFMTFDSFAGKSDTVAADIMYDDEETLVDTTNLQDGIYTVTNTENMGYLTINFRSADIELTVFDEEPIYNIPVTDGVDIYLAGADKGTANIDFEAQTDYVKHSSESYQGLFITGLSQFDDQLHTDKEDEYDKENVDICYPQINEEDGYEFECMYGSKEAIFDIPGSFQLAYH